MKVDKGLKEYLKGKDYALLTLSWTCNQVILKHKNKELIWEGSNSIFCALNYIKIKNWHPTLIRYG